MRHQRWYCTGCAGGCSAPQDDYMLQQEVWNAVHPEGRWGILCFRCLRQRAETVLGRSLMPQDFTSCGCWLNQQPAEAVQRLVCESLARLAFISMPMAGLSNWEVTSLFNTYAAQLAGLGYTAVDSLLMDPLPSAGAYLVESLRRMLCPPVDLVVAVTGWQSARGCRMEVAVALEYGIEVSELLPDGALRRILPPH